MHERIEAFAGAEAFIPGFQRVRLENTQTLNNLLCLCKSSGGTCGNQIAIRHRLLIHIETRPFVAALRKYNDGRMKRFLCELFIQRDLDTLQTLMCRAERISGTPKEAGKSFRALAEALDIETLPSRSD